MYMCVCFIEFLYTMHVQVLTEARRGLWISWNWSDGLSYLIRMFRPQPKSFTRSVCALNHRAIFLALFCIPDLAH